MNSYWLHESIVGRLGGPHNVADSDGWSKPRGTGRGVTPSEGGTMDRLDGKASLVPGGAPGQIPAIRR
jgi:hypothetical protein